MLLIRGLLKSFSLFAGPGDRFADGNRMNQTMERLQKMKPDEYSSFVRVLFGLTTPSPVPEDPGDLDEVEWIDLSLNDSQKNAIKFALASKEIALIHGPPGVRFIGTNVTLE